MRCLVTLTTPAAAMALLACSGTPSRIVAGVADTVIVNSAAPEAIPVAAFDSRGRPVHTGRVAFARLSGDFIAVSERGEVHCARARDAKFRASIGGAATEFMLYCRPIKRLGPGNGNYALFVDGPPQALDVTGVGLDRRPVTLLAARVGVRDSTVAIVVNSAIVARHPGQTRVDVEVAGFHRSSFVQVVQLSKASGSLEPNQAFMRRVTLADDSLRAWPVARGRYEVRFIPDDTLRGAVLLATSNANCARYPDGGAHLSCTVPDGGAEVLASARHVTVRRPESGWLFLRRLPDSLASVGPEIYWFDAKFPPAR